MGEEKAPKTKVKLVGNLYTAREVVGLIKDLLIMVFLIVLIFGIIFMINMADQIQLPF